jgi:hypothetical protein
MQYFHSAGAFLGVGSIIQPGNWGRMIRLYTIPFTNNQVNVNAYREAILELSRQIHAPDKPSRLEAVFTCPGLAEARSFRDRHHPFDLIYEVEPTVESPKTHVGDYALALAPSPSSEPYFQPLLDGAQKYWVSLPTDNIEVLFDCPMRVIAGPL